MPSYPRSYPNVGAHPYASFIHKVERPARYLGGEYQAITKAWSDVDVTVCLAFPDIYDIGMSHLGTKILYSLLNKNARIACERAFAPWVDMERELRERELPVVSLESARPLRDFDVVGFSLQYEMTFTNVLNLLDLSGIPLRAADRDDSYPLIIAGGPTTMHPEPVAPFIDAALIGDAEELLPRTLLLVAQWKRDGVSKRELLERMAALGGWYCPALYEVTEEPRNDLLVVDPDRSVGPYPVERAFVEDLDAYPFPSDAPVAAAEAIFDRMSIEIARGCTEGCRFCQAGMIYRPVRERDPDAIVDTVMAALDNGGYNQASLTSLSTADYSCISPLIKKVMERLRERRVALSVSSLRAYGLGEETLDEIASVKATGLTFAPEAGTARMRDVVNKNVSDEDIERSAHRVFSRGWQRMKLYFMIGLPTETDEDVAGIIDTAARVRDVGLQYHPRKRVQVSASASSHVPKPHTPFQWAAMDSMPEIQRKQTLLRERARRLNVTVKYHNQKISYLEGIVARGDRRVADLIELAWRKGCRFDGWDDQLKWDAWLEAIDELDIQPERYLRTLPLDGTLPWDHIDVGLGEGFLEKEWKRALKDRLSPPCGKPKGDIVHHTNLQTAEADERKLVCYHCGVACDLSTMRDERLGFLAKLGATEPPAPSPERPAPRVNKKGARLPPRRATQGAAHLYRVGFTKLGAVAMTSQLDLARVLPRLVRRAKLPMRFTEGFNPKPVMSYGPALPLGVASLAEVFDLSLLIDIAPEALVEQLDAVAASGLIVTGAARLPDGARAVARVAKLAEYVVWLPGVSGEALAAGLTRLAGDTPVAATVIRKKGPRAIDVRDGLVSAARSIPTPLETAALGIPAAGEVLRWRVDLNNGAHVRPGELCQAILDLSELPAGSVTARSGLWGLRKGQVFDLLATEELLPLDEHPQLPRAAVPAG